MVEIDPRNTKFRHYSIKGFGWSLVPKELNFHEKDTFNMGWNFWYFCQPELQIKILDKKRNVTTVRSDPIRPFRLFVDKSKKLLPKINIDFTFKWEKNIPLWKKLQVSILMRLTLIILKINLFFKRNI